jgi:hypothetical protein
LATCCDLQLILESDSNKHQILLGVVCSAWCGYLLVRFTAVYHVNKQTLIKKKLIISFENFSFLITFFYDFDSILLMLILSKISIIFLRNTKLKSVIFKKTDDFVKHFLALISKKC